MFNFKKKAEIAQPVSILNDPEFTPQVSKAIQVSEIDLLKKRVADQEEIIRELTIAVTFIANHKRFEHIQEKLINIHNLVDKLQKL